MGGGTTVDLEKWGCRHGVPTEAEASIKLLQQSPLPPLYNRHGTFLSVFFKNKFSLKDSIHREECTDQKSSARWILTELITGTQIKTQSTSKEPPHPPVLRAPTQPPLQETTILPLAIQISVHAPEPCTNRIIQAGLLWLKIKFRIFIRAVVCSKHLFIHFTVRCSVEWIG